MWIRILLVLWFLFFGGNLFSQNEFESALQSFLNHPDYRNALVGIHVADQVTGETLFELNSEKRFIPASVMKLVSSAAALEILGPGYRFRTKVGYTGEIKNGTLKGDLVISGGGDPALGSEYFSHHYFHPHFLETWIQRIKASGINRIEGDLVLDCSWYDDETTPPTWAWEDIGNYYGAGVHALTVYDNLLRIRFRSPRIAGLPTEIISVFPEMDGLVWKNEVRSSDTPRDLAYVFGSPFDKTRVIRGTIPKNRRSFTIKASNPFPGQLLANDFLKLLFRTGILVTGEVKSTNVPVCIHEIDVLESPSLAAIAEVMNRESINLFAEHMVKQVAAEKNSSGSRKEGLEIMKSFWEEKGLDTHMLFMEDGSGLSHFNAVSPAFLTSLLRYMAESSDNAGAFMASLPAAGQGTLHHFSPQLFPGKTLVAKSGSMTRVRCYAGYLQTTNGKKYVYSVMVNHFSGSHLNLVSEIEKLILGIQNKF